MAQKILFGAVIVLIVIGVVLLLLYQQQQSQPLEQEYEPDLGPIPGVYVEPSPDSATGFTYGNCPNLATQSDRDLCWSFQAGEDKDVELCNNISEIARKVICVEAVARELVDTRICEDAFPDNQDRLYHCITEIARDKLDYSLCDNMPQPYKDRCIRVCEEEEGLYLPTPSPT